VSGLFGVGGSLFAVPLMTTLRAMGQATAQGMGLAMVAPGTVVNLLVYGRAGNVDWTRGVALAVGGVVTMPLGVAIAHRLPERVLRAVLARWPWSAQGRPARVHREPERRRHGATIAPLESVRGAHEPDPLAAVTAPCVLAEDDLRQLPGRMRVAGSWDGRSTRPRPPGDLHSLAG
jgi:hypothetical protein